VRGGDVLLNITGASIGRVNQCPVALDGARVNQHVCIIRPVPELDSAFLRYLLSSPQQQDIIFQIETGVTRQALTKEMILNFEVPITPLNEQRRIVAKIEELFSDLDAGVAALERVRANLKRYRAAVLKAAVEGKLAEDWRAKHPNTEPASVLLERILTERHRRWCRDRCQEPAKADATLLPMLPDKWCWVTMKQLLSEPSCNGISVKGSHSPPGVPALRLTAMNDAGFDYAERRYIPINKEIATKLSVNSSFQVFLY